MSKVTASFTRPPLDGTLTVDQLYDWHRVYSANVPAFVFLKEIENQSDSIVNMTWKELGEGIARAVRIVQKHIPETVGGDLHQDRIVIGILATADIITYNTFLFAHLRLTHADAGYAIIPFPISTRNSPTAVSHLIQATGTKYLWVTDGPMKAIVNEALKQGGLADIVLLTMPSFAELYPDTSPEDPILNPEDYTHKDVCLDDPALILHSSGSSAFPNARTITHRILLEWSLAFENGDLNVQGEIMAVHGSPLFHAMGLFLSSRAAASGFVRAVPSPGVALPPLTPESFLEQILRTNSSIVFCVPSFMEEYSREPKSIQTLTKLKAIFCGGAPMKTKISQFLRKEGVPIQNLFGATEFGGVSHITAEPCEEGYEWFRFAPHVSPEFILDSEPEEEIYEVIFKECETHHMSHTNTVINGAPAYATNDLVQRHKSNSNLYRIIGRKDDQIMLSTGEKTNPGPLEVIIKKNSHVKNAIIFGRGRLSNGVIVEPRSYDEVEELGLEKFRNLIWPNIEEANDYAPAHSRIFKEMILVASAAKPLAVTAKQSPRRGIILNDYAQEIQEIYAAVQESSNVDIPIPAGSSDEGGWTLEESLDFVRKAVYTIMIGAEGLGDEDDLFGFGCDSLQATHIRNTVLYALRQIAPPANVQEVPPNFVYQHSTIRDLAMFAAQVSRSTTTDFQVNSEAARHMLLDDLVTKYTQNWPVHQPLEDGPDPTSEVILLTGSSGGLGSQIMAQLVVIPNVSRIYAFNRPARDGKTSRNRHVEAFMDRGNDVALLDSEKIVYVEGDAAMEGLGIPSELFTEIRDLVTTIIHNAWQVDFNISLSSFEPAIRSVRCMIDVALQSPHSSPPRVVFTSSVGIMRTWSDIPLVAEGPVTDLNLVNNSGYSESKWVSERLLWIAGQQTALRPIIVRLGQLSGGINGNWNVREWFPALTRASQLIGGVPDSRGFMSFLPLHVAASALIELRSTSSQFVHLVHPRPVHWSTIIQHIADALEVSVLPYHVWLERLEELPQTDEALQRNPALHLLRFYRISGTPQNAECIEEREAMGLAMFETTNTVTEAPSLSPARLPPLGEEDVNRWIDYWKSRGALDT